MDDIKTNLVRLILNNPNKIDINKFESKINLVNDFGFDSIKIVKLVMDIEDEFGITLYSDEFDYESIIYFDRLLETIKMKIKIKIKAND